MNIYLNLSNLTNHNDIFSVRVEILKKSSCNTKKVFFCKDIMPENRKIFITDEFVFENNSEYIVIYNIIQLGKQITKKILLFKYAECEEFFVGELILSKTKKINDKRMNIINEVSCIDINYYVTSNPLLVFRKLEQKYEIYLNGNLLFLKGKLYEIFEYILSIKDLNRIYALVDINESVFIDYINTLIRKGGIIVYEK